MALNTAVSIALKWKEQAHTDVRIGLGCMWGRGATGLSTSMSMAISASAERTPS